MVSKKKLVAGIALVTALAYTITRWKGSEPAYEDETPDVDVEA